MPDVPHSSQAAPASWADAFAALPLETAPAGQWNAVSARLDARRPRTRAPLWLATAAVLLLAVALPWRLHWSQSAADAPAATGPASAGAASGDPLESLYAESAQLEALLEAARDDRVASGTAALLAGELELRLASIDAVLMQPDLDQAQKLALWQERVDSLRSLAGFESGQRWLAAQGMRYDGALVRVD